MAKAVSSHFTSLRPPLSECSLAVLREYGFTTMSPVQAAAIPLFMSNKDVCVEVRPAATAVAAPAPVASQSRAGVHRLGQDTGLPAPHV